MTETITQNTLLQDVTDAHGGLERWRRFKGIASTIVTGGGLWDIKRVKLLRTPRRVTSEFRRQWMRETPFGEPGLTMTWTPEHIEIADSRGRIIEQRDNGRDAFDRSFNGRWDQLNLAYFNGYAMWTYHAAPWVLAEPGYEAREIEPIAHEGETLRVWPSASPRAFIPIPASSASTSARTACCGATTMRWTCGRTRRPHTSCRTIST